LAHAELDDRDHRAEFDKSVLELYLNVLMGILSFSLE